MLWHTHTSCLWLTQIWKLEEKKSIFYQISPSKNDSEDKSEFLISRGHWALAPECTLTSFATPHYNNISFSKINLKWIQLCLLLNCFKFNSFLFYLSFFVTPSFFSNKWDKENYKLVELLYKCCATHLKLCSKTHLSLYLTNYRYSRLCLGVTFQCIDNSWYPDVCPICACVLLID